MAIQNYKKFINKRQNDELTDITPDFGELVVGKDRVIVGLGDNTIYNTKEKELELERLQYYGDKNIIPSDENYFTVNAAGNTITGLTDTGKAQSGNLVIPYKINGVEITTLGNGKACVLNEATDKYTKIVIPNSITNIGSQAFDSCTSLVNINIPNTVTSIGSSAFYNCTSLKSINIPNSVTSIGSSVFSDCSSLKSINIPNSVTSIGSGAFYGCALLKSIEIPNSVTIINDTAFWGCTALKSINIPDSITEIGMGAFSNCSSLQSINIPNSITDIWEGVFSGCTSLKTINIPKSVTSIDYTAFSGITSLQLTIYCEQGSYAETYAQENGFNVVYTDLNKNKLVGQKTEDGGEILNDYVNNVASGDYSHAEGYKTKAGMKSFQIISGAGTEDAEGTYTLDSIENIEINSSAIIIYLTEENIPKQMQSVGTITEIGATNKTITVSNYKSMPLPAYTYYISIESNPSLGTTKTMNYSHSEGIKTQALGYGSHAEGNNTITLGFNSHAEGEETKAEGIQSHAEGYGSTTKSQAGHAEGLSTTVTNEAFAAHAEGWLTTAYAPGSHAEGSSTQATGSFSHAEGKATIANGFMSHTEGDTSKANGESSHSEGKETTANTIASHAEGYKTNAGIKCFQITSGTGTVNGEGTYILDSVEGILTEYLNNITGTIIAIGKKDENKIPTSIATIGTITALDSNTKTITVDNFKSCSLPIKTYYIYIDKVPNIGTTNIINYTHVEGIETQAFGYGSHAEGYCSLTKGNYSHAEGASQAIGEYSHSEGNSSIASGQFSHAEGFNTQSKAIGSHSEGEHTQANAEGAHAEGKGSIANGGYSHAEGDATEANEAASHSEGQGTKASAPAQHVEGKYNIIDDFGDYAHIIGNGESDTARSNALTVDWNGNLWIAGGLTFGMIDTLPTASASYRGKTIFKKDDTNGDKLYICIYNGSAYEWKEL